MKSWFILPKYRIGTNFLNSLNRILSIDSSLLWLFCRETCIFYASSSQALSPTCYFFVVYVCVTKCKQNQTACLCKTCKHIRCIWAQPSRLILRALGNTNTHNEKVANRRQSYTNMCFWVLVRQHELAALVENTHNNDFSRPFYCV